MRVALPFTVVLVAARSVTAIDVQLVGERVSFSANAIPLRTVLAGFARNGVRVRMDPEIDATVFGTARNEPVESALRKLLEPFGYVLIWDVMTGPLGDLPKLAEIQVFQPGHPDKALPFPPPSENFPVTTAPDGRGPRFVPDEILLAFRPGTRRDEFERLIGEIGGSVIHCAKGTGVYWIRLPTGANVLDLVQQLKRNPLIAHAEPNYIADFIPPKAESPPRKSTPSRTIITAPRSLAQTMVAVLDSGLLALDDLEGAVAASFDAVLPDRVLNDSLGHGTQMALIVTGAVAPEGTPRNEYLPRVPIAAVRTFDDHGRTTSFALLRAIEYALNHGARVISMSWGSTMRSDFLAAAIEKATSHGAVVVAAAGNEPTGNPIYPAAYENVVAVSGIAENERLWSQSNTGPFVSFSAPAFATFPVGYRGPPGTYAGTSIASAFVAHVLAQYFNKHPDATPREAIDALKKAVTDPGAPGRDSQYGYGIVDGAALARLLQQ